MILNYMLPIATLIILTTVYSLNGIRKINFELSKLEFTSSGDSLNEKKPHGCILDGEIGGLRECKGCLKALCVLQTGFGVVWFVAVLALENVDSSSGMAVVYLIVSFVLVSDVRCCQFLQTSLATQPLMMFVCFCRTGVFALNRECFCRC